MAYGTCNLHIKFPFNYGRLTHLSREQKKTEIPSIFYPKKEMGSEI